jgi:hypothetical protein
MVYRAINTAKYLFIGFLLGLVIKKRLKCLLVLYYLITKILPLSYGFKTVYNCLGLFNIIKKPHLLNEAGYLIM